MPVQRLFKGCSPLQLLCNWIGNRTQSATFHTAIVSGNFKTTMKQIIYILTITFGLLSCNNQSKQVDNKKSTDSDPQIKKVDNSKYHTQLDTIQITTELGDTLKYAKNDFNNIVDKHPEFFEEYLRISVLTVPRISEY